MNKRALVVIVVLVAVFISFRFCNSRPDVKAPKPTPLAVNANSGSFKESFQRLLSSYYQLKDAFVASDTMQVNTAAAGVLKNADSLNVNDIQGDTTGTIIETAKTFLTSINGSAKAIIGEKDLESKRREFNMVTDALWSLMRTVRYNGQKVYYDYCPMAFNNQGAYWLNNSREIKNPYYGNKMLTCGDVTDSLDYSKR